MNSTPDVEFPTQANVATASLTAGPTSSPNASSDASSDASPNANPSAPEPLPASPGDGDSEAQRGQAGNARHGELLGRFVSTAHQVIDRMADLAAPAVNSLEDTVASTTGGRVQQGAHELLAVGDEWMVWTRGAVREHPLAALGAAVAAGMLIAHLSRR